MQLVSKQIIVLNLNDFDSKEIIILSVDCVNYTTTEFRLDPGVEWYDHKHDAAGLKYEYGVTVHHVSILKCTLKYLCAPLLMTRTLTPSLHYSTAYQNVFLNKPYCVWIRGPFPAGKYNDLSVFLGKEIKDQPKAEWNRDALYWKIPMGKKAVADGIYSGCPDKVMVKRFGHPAWVTEYLDRIQNRQETYHERLSNFNILSARFRHGKSSKEKMELHRMAVDCVAFLVHYDLKYHPLMDV